jgi:beta-lactamase class D
LKQTLNSEEYGKKRNYQLKEQKSTRNDAIKKSLVTKKQMFTVEIHCES